MKRLASTTLCLLALAAGGCAKKEPKPLRTEPWLAHPSARAAANSDAALPLTRYVLAEGSSVRFEIPTKRGPLSGALSRVSGEFKVDLSNLAQSRGSVRGDLDSLTIHAGSATQDADATLLERARAALELTPDARTSLRFASFELSALEDALPAQIEAPPMHDAAAPSSRKARFTAVGDLLLHGFRVARRAPLEAEFSFTPGQALPSGVVIRSRAPLVISLETHAVVVPPSETGAKGPAGAATPAREVHVSVELYGTKVD